MSRYKKKKNLENRERRGFKKQVSQKDEFSKQTNYKFYRIEKGVWTQRLWRDGRLIWGSESCGLSSSDEMQRRDDKLAVEVSLHGKYNSPAMVSVSMDLVD